MKRIFALMFLILAAVAASAQAGTLNLQIVATLPSAAAAITINATTGVQTAGPMYASFYTTAATVTAGVASCPAYGSTWTLANATPVAVTSSAAGAAAYTVTGLTPGAIECFAVTNTFQAGGNPSTATVGAPIVIIILGSPLPAGAVAGSVVHS